MSFVRNLLLLVSATCVSQALAGNAYLCGNNEDGCDLSDPQSCVCVIQDEDQLGMHYCLNYHDDDNISCDAKKLNQACPADQESFMDEGSCAAVALQSEETPVCPERTLAFCQNRGIAIVDDKNLNRIIESLQY